MNRTFEIYENCKNDQTYKQDIKEGDDFNTK